MPSGIYTPRSLLLPLRGRYLSEGWMPSRRYTKLSPITPKTVLEIASSVQPGGVYERVPQLAPEIVPSRWCTPESFNSVPLPSPNS
jgi:hypothetical protein